MDWKILGASMIAILLIGGLLATQEGGLASSALGRLKDWLSKSPFEGFLVARASGPKEVSLTMSTMELSLDPRSPVNMTSQTAAFTDFKGRINISFEKKKVALASSSFSAELPLDEWHVYGLQLPSASFGPVKFNVRGQVQSDNGSVDMADFLGNATITPDQLLLEGNVSRLSVRMGDLEMELK